MIKETMFKPFGVFLKLMQRQSARATRGRQKANYDSNREFEQLLKQVKSGAISFLDTYDVELNCL